MVVSKGDDNNRHPPGIIEQTGPKLAQPLRGVWQAKDTTNALDRSAANVSGSARNCGSLPGSLTKPA